MKSVPITLALASIILIMPRTFQAQNTHKGSSNTKDVSMSTIQRNKEVIRKIYEESLNKRNMGLLQVLVSPEFVGFQGKKGAIAFEVPVASLIQAFPDIQWKIEELLGDGDKVLVKWKWYGTQTGQYQQFGATGKKVSNDGMGIFELKDGKVISSQIQTDRLGFLQQLEALPSDITKLSNQKSHPEYVQFIDQFIFPAGARKEFMERAQINRDFIQKLPGFVEDAAYERYDDQGNFVLVTLAVWENDDFLQKAKEAVQAEYKKQGFDPSEMMKRWHITMDRGIYKRVGN